MRIKNGNRKEEEEEEYTTYQGLGQAIKGWMGLWEPIGTNQEKKQKEKEMKKKKPHTDQ